MKRKRRQQAAEIYRMIKRETRKLIGSVKKVEAEFAVFEVIDGNLTETRNQSAGYSIYDLEGKLIEEVSPYRLMMYDAYKDVYFYDEDGCLSFRKEYDENNLLIGKTIFEQSVNGNRVEKHYYFDKQGEFKLGSHTVYEDDSEDEDSVIEIAHYDENEKINPQHFHKYNSSEKVKKNTVFSDKGYIVEEFRNREREGLIDKIITSYDSKGNRTEFSCFNSNGILTLKDEYSYEFDSVGNWIKTIQNHWVIGWGEFKLVPLLVIRRKIEYYKEN